MTVLDNFAGAIADFDLALQLDPKDAEKNAETLSEPRQCQDDSLVTLLGPSADFDLALQLDPNICQGAERAEARPRRQLGDFAGAIADFDLALQLDPKYAKALRRPRQGQDDSLVTLLGPLLIWTWH